MPRVQNYSVERYILLYSRLYYVYDGVEVGYGQNKVEETAWGREYYTRFILYYIISGIAAVAVLSERIKICDLKKKNKNVALVLYNIIIRLQLHIGIKVRRWLVYYNTLLGVRHYDGAFQTFSRDLITNKTGVRCESIYNISLQSFERIRPDKTYGELNECGGGSLRRIITPQHSCAGKSK